MPWLSVKQRWRSGATLPTNLSRALCIRTACRSRIKPSYYNTLITLDFVFCAPLRMPFDHRLTFLTTSCPTAHRPEDYISLILDLLEEDMLFEALICRAIGINAHSPRQGQQTLRKSTTAPRVRSAIALVSVHPWHAVFKWCLSCNNWRMRIDRDKNCSLPGVSLLWEAIGRVVMSLSYGLLRPAKHQSALSIIMR